MARFKIFYRFLFVSLLFVSEVSAEPSLYVTFLDVGEGDAIYIETSAQERILIDTGNPMTVFRTVDFLKKKDIRSLDALFITHPHVDHMGGLFSILPAFEVRAIYDNGQSGADGFGCDVYRCYNEIIRQGNYSPVKAGNIFRYGDVVIQVLWPRGTMSPDWNTNSLVLKMTYGDIVFLFMGDANIDVENVLLKEEDLKAHVLKVGHHGAADATGNDFISAVSPDYAVISVNAENFRGYPAPAVLKKLRSNNRRVMLTYSCGNITLITDGKTIMHAHGSEIGC